MVLKWPFLKGREGEKSDVNSGIFEFFIAIVNANMIKIKRK
jgi:hypothetical protein